MPLHTAGYRPTLCLRSGGVGPCETDQVVGAGRSGGGSDSTLAVGIAGVMIERGWCDREFVLDWTNGPLLVRQDIGSLFTERDLSPEGSASR